MLLASIAVPPFHTGLRKQLSVVRRSIRWKEDPMVYSMALIFCFLAADW